LPQQQQQPEKVTRKSSGEELGKSRKENCLREPTHTVFNKHVYVRHVVCARAQLPSCLVSFILAAKKTCKGTLARVIESTLRLTNDNIHIWSARERIGSRHRVRQANVRITSWDTNNNVHLAKVLSSKVRRVVRYQHMNEWIVFAWLSFWLSVIVCI
jgi:hypothetical protein